MQLRELPGPMFINRTSHAWLHPAAFLQLETVMQQLCRIAFDSLELLFHQDHIGMTALASLARHLAAVLCIQVLLLAKLIELFHGIDLAGARQIQFPRLGTARSSSHLLALSGAAILSLRVSFPCALLTFVTVTVGAGEFLLGLFFTALAAFIFVLLFTILLALLPLLLPVLATLAIVGLG